MKIAFVVRLMINLFIKLEFPLPFQGANQPPPPPMKPSELYYNKITPALKEKVRAYQFILCYFEENLDILTCNWSARQDTPVWIFPLLYLLTGYHRSIEQKRLASCCDATSVGGAYEGNTQ